MFVLTLQVELMSTAQAIPYPASGQTELEEWWNTFTHGVGTVLSTIGLVILVVFSAIYGDSTHIVSSSIYGTTLVILYLSSTLYHGAKSPLWKKRFLICDYCAIYLVIAGTYTPLALVTLEGAWGWTIFGIQWGMALVGMIVKGFMGERYRLLSTASYLIMGWMVVVAFYPLYQSMDINGIYLIVAGGLAYSFGVIFFLWDRLHLNHVIWHIFVILGSAFHYFAVLNYVVLA